MHHHNFRFDPKLGIGKAVTRWIPCSCEACLLKISKSWSMNDPEDPQPRYEGNDNNCIYLPIFEGLND